MGTSGVVATLPSLVKRWSEEARVLDGDNVIECADVTKPFILPEIEEIRDRALKEVKKSDTAEKMTDMTPGNAYSSTLLQAFPPRRSYRNSMSDACYSKHPLC